MQNYHKNSLFLYRDICSQLDGYDHFYLIDDNEDNIEAAKAAGWSTFLFDSSNYKNSGDFKNKIELEKEVTQKIKKLVSKNDRKELYTKVL